MLVVYRVDSIILLRLFLCYSSIEQALLIVIHERDVGCYKHGLSLYPKIELGTNQTWINKGRSPGSSEGDVYVIKFNYTRCLHECAVLKTNYVAVVYNYVDRRLDCRCGKQLPDSGFFMNVTQDVNLYCGYNCGNNLWCIGRTIGQRVTRGRLFKITYHQTTTTTSAQLLSTATITGTITPRVTAVTVGGRRPTSPATNSVVENTSFIPGINLTSTILDGAHVTYQQQGLGVLEITGITIGAAVFLAGLVSLIVIVFRKRRRTRKNDAHVDEDSTGQNVYDEAEEVKGAGNVVRYEEWAPLDKPASSAPAPPEPDHSNTADPSAEQGLYAVPDKSQKNKSKRPESENVEIVDNLIYSDERETQRPTKEDEATFYSTVG